jgi:hypothetical protein
MPFEKGCSGFLVGVGVFVGLFQFRGWFGCLMGFLLNFGFYVGFGCCGSLWVFLVSFCGLAELLLCVYLCT